MPKLNIGRKIKQQMGTRGWTKEMLKLAYLNPRRTEKQEIKHIMTAPTAPYLVNIRNIFTNKKYQKTGLIKAGELPLTPANTLELINKIAERDILILGVDLWYHIISMIKHRKTPEFPTKCIYS